MALSSDTRFGQPADDSSDQTAHHLAVTMVVPPLALRLLVPIAINTK
jgi:hypothetical protein